MTTTMHPTIQLLFLSTLIPLAFSAGCSTFQVTQKFPRVNANESAARFGQNFPYIQISDDVQCNSTNTGGGNCNSTTCELTSKTNVWIRVGRSLHLNTTVSVSETVADQIFSLVSAEFPNAENINTQADATYNTGGSWSSACIPEGTQAYWGFMPALSCVEGTVGSCQGNGIQNGTLIYACGVLLRNGTANDEVPTIGYAYINTVQQSYGSEISQFTNATATTNGTSSGAARGMDMVGGKILSASVLLGVFGMGFLW